MASPVIDVALALVRRGGLWLVARRPPLVHLGGLWEFPGGKCRPDEPPGAAAVRELREECGVRAAVERVLPPVTWAYPDRVLRLTPVLCRWQAGDARSRLGTECRWVSSAELPRLEMPPANAEIIRAALESGPNGVPAPADVPDPAS